MLQYLSNNKKLFFIMITLLVPIIIHYFVNNNYVHFSLNAEKCPFCYGNNLCAKFNNNEITFTNLTLADKIFNLVNSKNVYTANYNNKKVILKKLGHNWELAEIDDIICTNQNSTANCPPFSECYDKDFTSEITKFLINDNINNPLNLKLCSLSTMDQFINVLFAIDSHLNISVMTANIWTTVLANAEPLLLQILNVKDGWPVPIYYGACGRVIVEEYCGRSLNFYGEEPWITRAKLALKLLEAADNFTNKHPIFRFYLTDISSDNIVVTDDYDVKFVDLENVIIAEKKFDYDDSRPHESKNFDCEDCYAFSPDEICSHSISDHNFYSVCKLLLSENAPWPMMLNGLLHSPANYISEKYPKLFEYVEICAESSAKMNRFEAAKQLIRILNIITTDKTFNN